MPTKTLLESAGRYRDIREADKFGIRVNKEAVSIDWSSLLERKNAIVSRLVQGIQYLMKKNKIKIVQGKAAFQSPHVVLAETANGTVEIKATSSSSQQGLNRAPSRLRRLMATGSSTARRPCLFPACLHRS